MVGVKTGALNFPKMLRHLQHRTNQVKDLTFLRRPLIDLEAFLGLNLLRSLPMIGFFFKISSITGLTLSVRVSIAFCGLIFSANSSHWEPSFLPIPTTPSPIYNRGGYTAPGFGVCDGSSTGIDEFGNNICGDNKIG